MLIVDDNPAIHDDFRRVLLEPERDLEFERATAQLFGEPLEAGPGAERELELAFASQGQDAHEMVVAALREGRPFALAFVDMRMPPGWDGLVTIEHLWGADPRLQVVICSAFSDYSWAEVRQRLGNSSNLLILKKPFDCAEVAQVAAALTGKWEATRREQEVMENLERLVEERTRELEEARCKAVEASRIKSDFVATMSHEIRTPMNGLMAAVSMLKDCSGEQRRECIEIIRTSGNTLLALVNDVLDYSKIEAGKLTLEEAALDLHELVERQVGAMRFAARDKDVTLRSGIAAGVPRYVLGDAVRLHQVLGNVIGNAIKFTDAGGEVDVELVRRGDDGVALSVRDTGIGIARDHVECIFARFTQADSSTTRRFGGSGLGLTISRHLVELMGGRMTVASEVGVGSTFTIELPLRHAGSDELREPCGTAQACSACAEHVAEVAGLRVLLAEDNEINQRVAVALLQSLRCSVDVAADGRQALEMATVGSYDVVLMDCQMPQLDGYEATRLLRETGRRVPIVAVTATALRGDRERCLAAGMDDYVCKPMTRQDLLAVLRRVRRAALRT